MRKFLAALVLLFAPSVAVAGSVAPNPANVDSLPTSGLTQYGLVYGNTKQGVKSLTDIGSAHVLLHGNATGLPTWGLVDLSTETTGTLPPSSCAIAAISSLGCVKSPGSPPVAHYFLQTFDASGNPVTAQPSCSDLSDAVSTCNSLASPTFTGTIGGANETLSGTFTLTGANPQERLDTAAGVNRSVAFRTGGLDRFQIRVNSTAEGGSNAGSDFELRRYTDAGTLVDVAFGINRSTGVVTITDGLTLPVALTVANGGTGASTAAAARTNLGVAIGSNVEAWSTYLDCLSNLPPATGLLRFGSVGACSAGITVSVAEGGTGSGTAGGARTNLGLAIGSNVQAWSTYLDCLSGLPPATGIIKFGSVGACSAGAATFADLGGTLGSAQFGPLTGDVTTSGYTATVDRISGFGSITPPTITASVNDYAPSGFSSATVLRLSANSLWSVTGLAGGAAGRVVSITNVGSTAFVLTSQDTGSSAANRFALPFAADVRPGQSVALEYDGTLSRWILFSGTASPLEASNNLSDVSNAGTARSNLGLAIGTNVEAWSTYLDCLAALPPSTGILKFGTVGACSAGAASIADLTGLPVTIAQGGTGATTSATAWTNLNLYHFDATYAGGSSLTSTNQRLNCIGSIGAVSGGTWVLASSGTASCAQITYPFGVSDGGTGGTTFANNAVLYGGGTSPINALAVNSGSTHQYLTQFSSGTPAWATIQQTDINGLGTASTANTGTSAGTLGFLNTANTISGANIYTAAQQFAAGTCAAPSVDVGSGNDTGLYQDATSGSDNLGLCAGAHLRGILFSSNSGAGVVFAATAANALPTSIGGTNSGIENVGNAQFGNYRQLLLVASTASSTLVLAHSRSTTLGTFSALQAGDGIGDIRFAGDDGASYDTLGAQIRGIAKTTWTTGNGPTDILFNLMNNAGSLRQVLCIDADTGLWNGVNSTGAACGASGFNFLDRSNNANFATVAISGATTVDANGNFTGGAVAPATQVVSPATGFSQTISANIDTLLITPSTTLATGTVKMPASPLNNQRVTIATSQTITAFTLSPNTGQTVNGAPTTLPANTSATFKYQVATTTWYRLQ